MSDAVERLRAVTGASAPDCRRALQDAGGDVEVAAHLLDAEGLAPGPSPSAGAGDETGAPWRDAAPERVETIAGVPVFFCEAQGPGLRHAADAVDLIAQVLSHGARMIALPTTRLGSRFLPLSTRVAGDILQKVTNYGLRIAILGDLGDEIAASKALHDFVYESNKGDQVWFVAGPDELEAMLRRRG